MSSARIPVAIIGSGNIGTDLMIKILRYSSTIKMGAMVGIDPASDGLARAERLGVPTTAGGIDGLLALPHFKDIRIAFDATSAGAHKVHDAKLRAHGIRVIDLTPAAIGPYVIPVVNFEEHAAAPNLNMVTCGGQATIPIVHAVAGVAPVAYAEIVAAISSKSAGPGTRANIDEFTETTSRAIVDVGKAARGKAIIVLNPAEPPLIMRDTVYCFVPLEANTQAIAEAVEQRVAEVRRYVPGYRLKQRVQFEHFTEHNRLNIPGLGWSSGIKVAVFLEVEGAGHYLPAYAGNLDIMTSAALTVAERIAQTQLVAEAV
ncbi:acetaldehyde dehydrogenase (acetylating) [Pseudomonas japonica]|uniref:acetaldehyde dehydrogenase (acetylating) n=1 Tax=Pseudomonas japonica TaxID=256466 RepID=UPI0015E2A5AE|nr:acetaldehyde dehydrogenase (acetylating) [Pseudomonas japonica]MBA1291620.1 acetaldehyde dehydrogenase (acetylating) [Pseudomonas japonica]